MALVKLSYINGDNSMFCDAIEKFDKAVEYRPDFAEAHMNCGLALAGFGCINRDIELLKLAYHKLILAKENDGDLPVIKYYMAQTLYDYAALSGDKEASEQVRGLFLTSYLLCIIDERFDFVATAHERLDVLAKETNDDVIPIFLKVFTDAISYVCFGDKRHLAVAIEKRLRDYKGKSSIIDIVIDAILEKKVPDNNDSNLLVRACVKLANDVIQMGKIREIHAKYFRS